MGDPGNDVPSDRDSGDGFSLRGHTRAIRHLDAARAAELVRLFDRPIVGGLHGLAFGPDDPLTVAAAGVLANDVDVDGDPLTALLVTAPTHGTLVLNANGGFTYLPAAQEGPRTLPGHLDMLQSATLSGECAIGSTSLRRYVPVWTVDELNGGLRLLLRERR